MWCGDFNAWHLCSCLDISPSSTRPNPQTTTQFTGFQRKFFHGGKNKLLASESCVLKSLHKQNALERDDLKVLTLLIPELEDDLTPKVSQHSMHLQHSQASASAASHQGSQQHSGILSRDSVALVSPAGKRDALDHHGRQTLLGAVAFGSPAMAGGSVLNLVSKRTKEILHIVIMKIMKELSLRKSAVVVLDDAQWMDKDSLELLTTIANICKEITTILAFRPISSKKKMQYHLAHRNDAVHIKLDALTLKGTREVMCGLLANNHIDSAAVEFTHERSRGVPQAIISIVEQLASKGIIAVHEETGDIVLIKNLYDIDVDIDDNCKFFERCRCDLVWELNSPAQSINQSPFQFAPRSSPSSTASPRSRNSSFSSPRQWGPRRPSTSSPTSSTTTAAASLRVARSRPFPTVLAPWSHRITETSPSSSTSGIGAKCEQSC